MSSEEIITEDDGLLESSHRLEKIENHRQVIDRYLTDFSHASSYRKILRAMRI